MKKRNVRAFLFYLRRFLINLNYEDKNLWKFVINRYVPFPVMLQQAGFDNYEYDKKVYCPFHNNFDTESAKLFHNKDGDTLFCFSENRVYRPSDLIDRGILKKSLYKMYKNIWNQLSDESKERLLSDYGKPINTMPLGWDLGKKELGLFKNGKIDYTQYVASVIRLLQK